MAKKSEKLTILIVFAIVAVVTIMVPVALVIAEEGNIFRADKVKEVDIAMVRDEVIAILGEPDVDTTPEGIDEPTEFSLYWQGKKTQKLKDKTLSAVEEMEKKLYIQSLTGADFSEEIKAMTENIEALTKEAEILVDDVIEIHFKQGRVSEVFFMPNDFYAKDSVVANLITPWQFTAETTEATFVYSAKQGGAFVKTTASGTIEKADADRGKLKFIVARFDNAEVSVDFSFIKPKS